MAATCSCPVGVHVAHLHLQQLCSRLCYVLRWQAHLRHGMGHHPSTHLDSPGGLHCHCGSVAPLHLGELWAQTPSPKAIDWDYCLLWCYVATAAFEYSHRLVSLAHARAILSSVMRTRLRDAATQQFVYSAGAPAGAATKSVQHPHVAGIA